jgi:hypothetical protein
VKYPDTLTISGIEVDSTNDWAKWDASDITWTNATFAADGAVIYDTTANDTLICFYNTGELSPNGSDLLLQVNTNGLMTIA